MLHAWNAPQPSGATWKRPAGAWEPPKRPEEGDFVALRTEVAALFREVDVLKSAAVEIDALHIDAQGIERLAEWVERATTALPHDAVPAS
jgi:hypothetical protein